MKLEVGQNLVNGFYWVRWRPYDPSKSPSEPLVAEFDEVRQCWFTPGCEQEEHIRRIEVLSERLEAPKL